MFFGFRVPCCGIEVVHLEAEWDFETSSLPRACALASCPRSSAKSFQSCSCCPWMSFSVPRPKICPVVERGRFKSFVSLRTNVGGPSLSHGGNAETSPINEQALLAYLQGTESSAAALRSSVPSTRRLRTAVGHLRLMWHRS